MSKRVFRISLFISLYLALLYFPRQSIGSTSSPQNLTIPTRTPTPGPPSPTPTPAPTDNSSSGNETPTATGEPQATATSTLIPITIAATPVGGFLPTSVPCGSQPTIQTYDETNVRRGPGADYEIVGTLVYLEVRYILGRAGDAEWWLIQLENGEQGWVADAVVSVQGYTGIVPVVPPPPINGNAPTPGAAWNPTPPPACTVTPMPTATPTVTEETTEGVALGVAVTVLSPATTNDAEDATPTAAVTAVPPTSVLPTVTANSQAVAAVSSPPPTAPPLDVEAPSGTPNFLPFAGLVLLAAGVFLLLARRRRRTEN